MWLLSVSVLQAWEGTLTNTWPLLDSRCIISWAALAAALWLDTGSTHQPTAIIVEPLAMGLTAAVTPTALMPILMFSPEPWLEDQETRMTTTTTRGTTLL